MNALEQQKPECFGYFLSEGYLCKCCDFNLTCTAACQARSINDCTPAELDAAIQPAQSLLVASDGSTASYYELPKDATELQDLISYRNMNAQVGEMFRACYRYGRASHSSQLRDMKKVKFYAEAEIARLEKYK